MQTLLDSRIKQLKLEIKDNLNNMEDKNLESYQQFINQYIIINNGEFQEEIRNSIGFLPTEILIKELLM